MAELAGRLEDWGRTRLGFPPHDWQVKAASVVLNHRKDLVVIARTGDGKSAVFQLLMATGKNLIVVSPILGLITEQVAHLQSSGVAAAAVTSETLRENSNLWAEISSGKYQAVYSTPEMLLLPSSYFWHKMIHDKANKFLSKLVAIVIDEVHIIWKWGESGFRPEYAQIGDVRSYLPSTPFVLLSATITPNVMGYLHKTLSLMRPTVVHKRSIGRTNLRLVCARARAKAGTWTDLDFLVSAGTEDVEAIPKTMVFVDHRSVAMCIANYLRSRLSTDFLQGDRVQTICTYTAALDTVTRDKIMADFREGDTRLLVCTDAAGMGMDIPDVEVAIQYRLTTPSGTLTLADVYQRLGRCARDQSIRGLAIVFVEEKFILPGEVDATMSAYKLAVEMWHEVEVKAHTQTIYSRDKPTASAATPYASLDPGLFWLINTYGCRMAAVLAVFNDPDAYTVAGAACGCDNCFFPGRQEHDKISIPDGLACDGMLEERRSDAARELGGLVDQPNATAYGFNYRLSMRYEDSPAYPLEVAEAARKMVESQRNRTAATVRTTKETSSAVSDKLRVARVAWCSELNGDDGDWLPEDLLTNTQVDGLAKKARSISDRAALSGALGTKYDLESSILSSFAGEMIDAIKEAVQEFDASEMLAAEAAETAVELALVDQARVEPGASDATAITAGIDSNLLESEVSQPPQKKPKLGRPAKGKEPYKMMPRLRPESEYNLNDPLHVAQLKLQREYYARQAEIEANKAIRRAETNERKAKKIAEDKLKKGQQAKQSQAAIASQQIESQEQGGGGDSSTAME